MKTVIKILSFIALSWAVVLGTFAKDDPVVVSDGDFSITKSELEFLVAKWTKQMQDSALQDEGDRLELLNLMLANKKVANDADKLVKENPELTWEYQQGLNNYKINFAINYYTSVLEYPDFSKLAAERYEVNKDKWARVPERRMSSHILFSSPPGKNREGVLAEAAEVLAQLRDGADFFEMVTLHSDEPGAVKKQGKFDRWIAVGDSGVSPPYIEGVFSIGAIGEYSDLVQTQFGVHIIRLDGVEEQYYEPFEKVQDNITTELRNEYAQLALKNYLSQFNLSDKAVVDDALLDEVLAPYARPE